MVNYCVNSDCREELKVLNAGDLYALERRSADTEFFWLCSACASRFDMYFDLAGRVSVRQRSEHKRARPPHPDGHLRLVSRSIKRTPWSHAVPDGEEATSFLFRPGRLSPVSRVRGGFQDE